MKFHFMIPIILALDIQLKIMKSMLLKAVIYIMENLLQAQAP
jgi:hypothetical protein